jgi:hypothetical protein
VTVYSVAASAPSFDIGRVVKRTFSILGADLLTFGLLTLALVVLPMAVSAWLQMQGLSASQPASLGGAMAALGKGLVSLLWGIVVWALSSMAYAAVIKAAVSHMEDRPMGFGEALAAGAPLAPGVMLVSLLVGLGVVGGCFLFLIPGLMLAIRWAVAVPARIIEGPNATGAMGRSAQLTKNRRWAIFGLFLVFGLISMILEWVLVAAAGGPISLFQPGKTRLAWTLMSPIIQLFVFPIASVGLAALYVELRGGTGVQATAEVFS